MKTVKDLMDEIKQGLFGIYQKDGDDALYKELSERIARFRDEILVAWHAEHGFEPHKAVLVEQRTEDGWQIYIRENTKDEAGKYVPPVEIKRCLTCGNTICPLNGFDCQKFVKK